MQLKALLESIHVKEKYLDDDFFVTGISYHSNRVSDGNIFVCIKGYKTDGHKYLQSAVENGAKAAIVEEINENIKIPQFVVPNSRIALAQLSAAYYGNPSHKMKMIGITATNGKTTTSFLANSILENHGLKTGLIGTIHVKINDQMIPSDLTTPESLELQKYFYDMEKNDVSHVVMEVSSAALEMHRVETVPFDIVTLNNINREHIDTHGSFENYVNMKTKLIKNASKDSVAVLNLDCPYTEQLLKETKATPITFSVHSERGDLFVKNLDLSTGRAKFTVVIPNDISVRDETISSGEFDIQLSIPGLHSVSNSMVAMIIGLINGVSIQTIQHTLKNFKGVERRFEFIYEEGPIVIDDHFANPGNIEVTLETISKMKYDKLNLVYAVRGQRGPIVNRENAETVVKWAKKLELDEIIVTKSVSDVTFRDEVTDEELNAFVSVMEEANIDVFIFDELRDAIYQSISISKPNDLILLAGCQGMDHGAKIALEYLQSDPIMIK